MSSYSWDIEACSSGTALLHDDFHMKNYPIFVDYVMSNIVLQTK